MKTIQFLLLFLLFFNADHTFAQPGDTDLKYRLRCFHELQDSILKYPNKHLYKWVRADILFRPRIQLRTKSTKTLNEFLSQSSEYQLYIQDSVVIGSKINHMSSKTIYYKEVNQASVLGDFLLENYKVLVEDLTELIEADVKFKHAFINTIGQYQSTANKSSFLFKRGKFYYFSGNADKALLDFKAALNNEPLDDLKQKIYLAIAAHYYNTENTENNENYTQALKYISLIEPALEDSSFFKGEEPTYYGYEKEKLELMEKYQDSTAYVNYLQNRTASYLNWYYSTIKDSEIEKSNMALKSSLEYERMIYDYLKAVNPNVSSNELKRQKAIIINKL